MTHLSPSIAMRGSTDESPDVRDLLTATMRTAHFAFRIFRLLLSAMAMTPSTLCAQAARGKFVNLGPQVRATVYSGERVCSRRFGAKSDLHRGSRRARASARIRSGDRQGWYWMRAAKHRRLVECNGFSTDGRLYLPGRRWTSFAAQARHGHGGKDLGMAARPAKKS